MEVRTRFAPSPTGSLHIGGVRTALYAYLIAKKNNGKFYLRIEDTDRARFVEGAAEDIIETIKWLGLDFDGEVIYQSDRKKIYEEHAQKLVKDGKAYEEEGAIWFKINPEGTTVITDLSGNRKLEIPNSDQKDFVILKSDGFPTYHLAHVVDDHLMDTNPVIRGPEWISSLPKHIQLFEAFGWEPTPYAHIPTILGSDKSKLSKRHGAKPASEFRKDGFLPEAILNYMVFLGWTPPSGKEMLTLDEMADEFDLKDVHVSNPVFDIVKLEWMNGEYIRKMSNEELTKRLQEFLVDHPSKDKIGLVVPLIKERIKKLSDFVPLTDFLWEKPEYDEEVFKMILKRHSELVSESQQKQILNQVQDDIVSIMKKILEELESMEKPWESDKFEKTFRDLAGELEISVLQMFQLIRIAVSGQTVTPPLFESIKILGEDETISRINKTLFFINS